VPPRNSYAHEPTEWGILLNPSKMKKIEFALGQEDGKKSFVGMRFYNTEDIMTNNLTCRGSEIDKLELELKPGEKIIGANVTHTPKEENFKTILQMKFLIVSGFETTNPM
jgi:hypothetical protein